MPSRNVSVPSISFRPRVLRRLSLVWWASLARCRSLFRISDFPPRARTPVPLGDRSACHSVGRTVPHTQEIFRRCFGATDLVIRGDGTIRIGHRRPAVVSWFGPVGVRAASSSRRPRWGRTSSPVVARRSRFEAPGNARIRLRCRGENAEVEDYSERPSERPAGREPNPRPCRGVAGAVAGAGRDSFARPEENSGGATRAVDDDGPFTSSRAANRGFPAHLARDEIDFTKRCTFR